MARMTCRRCNNFRGCSHRTREILPHPPSQLRVARHGALSPSLRHSKALKRESAQGHFGICLKLSFISLRNTLHVTLPKGKEKDVIGKHSRVDVTGPLNTPLAQNSHPTELPETFSPDFRIIHEGGSKTNETRVPENCLRVTFCAFFVTRDDLG